MSVQLRREHGKNETNKKALRVSMMLNVPSPTLKLIIKMNADNSITDIFTFTTTVYFCHTII